MGRSKPALNSLNAHLKNVPTLVGTFHMVLLQIPYYPQGQGLLSPATLLFNCLVCGVMPVLDRKPIGGDNDDEHNSKLVHRQHKSKTYNDASPLFASIPMGSPVVDQ